MQGIYSSFLEYISNFSLIGIQFLFLAIALVYLISYFILKVTQSKSPLSQIYHARFWLIVSSSIVILITLIVYLQLWSSGYYVRTNAQLMHLLIFLVECIFLLVLGFNWSRTFSIIHYTDNTYLGLTASMQSTYNRKARSGFVKLKAIILLPLFGFLLVPLMSRGVPNLISILIDTSNSMDPDRLNKTERLISNTLAEFHANEHVILSWFDTKTDPPRKQNLSEISNEMNPENLCGNHLYFSEASAAVNFFRNNELLTGGDSPLIETLWGHFQFSQREAPRSEHGKIVLLILSDGNESALNVSEINESSFFCTYEEFENYYDEIIFINISNSSTSIFQDLADGCGFNIIDGSDLDAYLSAISNTLEDYLSNYHYILMLFTIYVFTVICFTIITPKR